MLLQRYTSIAIATVFGAIGLLSHSRPGEAASLSLNGRALATHPSPSLTAPLGPAPLLLGAALPESSQPGSPQVANGTYLFGDTPEPGQLGHEYMIMEVQGDRVLGGFYQPSSEYSCFEGSVSPTELTLQVLETYTNEVSTYRVPLYLNNTVAASEFILPYENALGLQGTHRIEAIGDTSLTVLEACRADLAQ